MNNSETKKQFQITLFQSSILITTPTNRIAAYECGVKLSEQKKLRLLDKYDMTNEWIETKENELNYYECCGVLILFGNEPPTFIELCKCLNIAS